MTGNRDSFFGGDILANLDIACPSRQIDCTFYGIDGITYIYRAFFRGNIYIFSYVYIRSQSNTSPFGDCG